MNLVYVKPSKQLAVKTQIENLQNELLKMPQADIVTEHIFSPGIYERKITIPPWTVLTGAEHKTNYKIKLEKGDYRKTEICISITDENTKMNYGYTASEASNFIVNSDSTVELFVNYFAGNNFNEIRNSSRLSCYIWNKGKSSFRIIDFKIKTIDYWNQKWNFWN